MTTTTNNTPALPKKLSDKLECKLRDAVNMSGSYKPDDNMFYIEESLTIDEYVVVLSFFTWVHKNNLTFGRNVKKVYLDFVAKNQGIYQEIAAEYSSTLDNLTPLQPVVVVRGES